MQFQTVAQTLLYSAWRPLIVGRKNCPYKFNLKLDNSGITWAPLWTENLNVTLTKWNTSTACIAPELIHEQMAVVAHAQL